MKKINATFLVGFTQFEPREIKLPKSNQFGRVLFGRLLPLFCEPIFKYVHFILSSRPKSLKRQKKENEYKYGY